MLSKGNLLIRVKSIVSTTVGGQELDNENSRNTLEKTHKGEESPTEGFLHKQVTASQNLKIP